MIIELNSVGCVLDTDTLLTYPLYKKEYQFKYNKIFDETSSVHLNDCIDEWYENLDENDTEVVNEYLVF